MRREEMKSVIELAYRRYTKVKEDVTSGFIKGEHIKLVSEALFLEELTDEELNEMWNACNRFFNEMYCVLDENGRVVDFKPFTKDTEFIRDTQSAWSEVINEEARKRKQNDKRE